MPQNDGDKTSKSASAMPEAPQPGKTKPPIGKVTTGPTTQNWQKTQIAGIKNGAPLPVTACLGRVITTVPSPLKNDDFQGNDTQCLFNDDRPKRVISTIPNFPLPIKKPPKVRHRIGASRTGGLGMFATRDLKLNQLIFAERPLMIVPTLLKPIRIMATGTPDAQKFQACMDDQELALQMMLNRMSPENYAAFMALSNSHTEDGMGRLLGTARTNGFSAEFGSDAEREMYFAVCTILSRINHSCSPNVAVNFDVASFSSELRAVRDIKNGEEILVQYCPVNLTTAQRQEELRAYGFLCACPRCTDPASDRVCQRIIAGAVGWDRDLLVGEKGPENVRRKIDHAAGLERARKWLAIMDEEGLQTFPQYEHHIMAAANAAMGLKSRKEMIKYIVMRRAWNQAVQGKIIENHF